MQCAATTVETWLVWNAGGVATTQIFQLDKSYGADGMVVKHPPCPPIASQSISRDVPLAQVRAFCDRALREHRRSSSLPSPTPSKLARYTLQRVAWIGPSVRASNDINAPSKLARYLSGMRAD